MKNKLGLWQFFGFGFTSLFGTLLHFLYEWSEENVITALFSGVNESTWEHMKLLYFPLLVFSIIEYFVWGQKNKNYWCIKLIGTTVGLISIPVIFYTLNGIFGKTPDWVNITIFFVAAALTFLFETYLFKKNKKCIISSRLSFILLFAIGILFFIFTFSPPYIELFKDPITNTYGI